MRADRLVTIILMLQTRKKMTAQALAQALEVSPRTILRDVDALSAAGIPIYAEGGHGGGIALDEQYRVTLTGLKEAEIRALFVASDARLLHEVGLGEASEQARLKLEAALPTPYRPTLDYIRQRVYIDPLWWWHDTDPRPLLTTLQQAVYEDRRIKAVYEHHNGEIVERTLEPYSLVAKSSLWYVVAKHHDQLRTYRASRFHAATLLDQHFERSVDFDLPTYWQAHVQEFVSGAAGFAFTLRIDPNRLNFVAWLTPGRYEVIETAEDGWLTVRLQFETIELAKMLVFGLGTQAEIVEPDALRDAVRESACAVLDQHPCR
jgi:predicted DNA-binding transcriptional regulator YafY